MSKVIEIGITPTLLLTFVLYFLKRDNRHDKQLDDLKQNFKEQITTLLAEGVRREEIMRTEAEKREAIMRGESERRDVMFSKSIDSLDTTMEKMSDCMDDMKKAFLQMDFRLQNIEIVMERRERRDG